MNLGADPFLKHCTLPEELAALRSAFELLTGTNFPPWPSIPGEQTAQAGWIFQRNGQTAGAALLRRQTKTRGVLGLAADPELLAQAGLLPSAAEQAAAWELNSLIAPVPAAASAMKDYLKAGGFAPAGKLTVLETAPPLPAPAARLPGEYFFKRFDALNHPPTLAATLNRAYADRTGRPENEHGTVTVDTILPDLAERTWLLLNFFGKGVAVIRSPADGWLEAPGVVPEERDNGLHLALLTRVLQLLPGEPAVWRMVCFNDPGAVLEDYRQAGFRIAQQHTLFQKDL